MKAFLSYVICFIFIFACLSSNVASNDSTLSPDEKKSLKIIGKWQGAPSSFDNYVRMIFRKDGTGKITENKYPTEELIVAAECKWRIENNLLQIEITRNIFRVEGNNTLKVGSITQSPITGLSDKRLSIDNGDDSIPDAVFLRYN